MCVKQVNYAVTNTSSTLSRFTCVPPINRIGKLNNGCFHLNMNEIVTFRHKISFTKTSVKVETVASGRQFTPRRRRFKRFTSKCITRGVNWLFFSSIHKRAKMSEQTMSKEISTSALWRSSADARARPLCVSILAVHCSLRVHCLTATVLGHFNEPNGFTKPPLTSHRFVPTGNYGRPQFKAARWRISSDDGRMRLISTLECSRNE